ncbi:SH2 domain-containing protein 7 isoform X2 [Sardina pilchardus]|uniref:SH2 domain-containing protein 7 isoform X2 n=1 Tax=Sardina pilchardus TaxID=27697 RepID=UPI002E10A8CE
MEFDYQTLKDAEGRQREERISTLPIQMPRPSAAQDQCASHKPPVKPCRSIKCRPAATQESGPPNPLASQAGHEVVVKRMSPAVMLGPAGPLEALSPSLRAHTLLWFHRSQLPRLQTQGRPLPRWLHGFATRREAEQLLHDQPMGCFLLRLSESKIGFVLSYRGKDRCRHFIIEEEDGGLSGKGGRYLIAGENSRHCSLEELIAYYTQNPVGPFDEVLTVPCTKANGLSDDIIRKRVGDREQGKEPSGQVSLPPAPLTSAPLPKPGEAASKDTPEYAVVRKALRKSHSLPESPSVPDTALPCLQVFNAVSSPKESTVCQDRPTSESDTHSTVDKPTDVPYARVNKPPRALAQTPQGPAGSSASGLQGAMAPSAPTSPQASAEQKYWHLEPEHTYEETPATATAATAAAATTTGEQIDFYAMGRRREVQRSEGTSGSHVYSEVNLRGARENPTLTSEPAPIRASNSATAPASLRNAPNLPARPPPRHTNIFSRPDNSVQNFGGPLLSTSPSRSGHFPPHLAGRPLPTDPSAIYEQIPERSSGPRPPLPPPNPKH